jgi:hypothetical protein
MPWTVRGAYLPGTSEPVLIPDPGIIWRCKVRWWEVQPARVAALEGPSLKLDPTIARLDGEEIDRNRDLRLCVEKLGVEPDDVLAYRALADGRFGRYRLVAVFPLPPNARDPSVFCLDGLRGELASPHRNGEAELCLYFKRDPPERRWMESQGLLRLFDLARQHVTAEHVWRETGQWPIDEAPHGETEPAPPDPSLNVPPLRWPNRKGLCPCGSGRKAKRCCFP